MELPQKFWINSQVGNIVPVELYHDLDILENPTKYGFPPGMRGTEFAYAVQLVRSGKWRGIRDSELGTDLYYKMKQVMFLHHWVRVDAHSSDNPRFESGTIKDLSLVLRKLIEDGYGFISITFDLLPPGLPRTAAVDFLLLDDWDEIVELAYRRRLPRRYAHLVDPRTIRPKMPAAAMAGIEQVGKQVGDRMEAALSRARMIEARRPTRTITPTRPTEFADPRSRGELTPGRTSRLPGRLARPGAAHGIRVPDNAGVMKDLLDMTTGSDSVSDDQARQTAGHDQQLRLGGAQNQLVPLNQLPELIEPEAEGTPNLTWHPIPSLPTYVVNMIRAAFRPFFQSVLHAEIEQISVVTDLPGAGTDEHDLNALWDFLLERGRIDDQFSMEAFGLDPAVYHVRESHTVDFGGHRFFLMIEDHAGGTMGSYKYIYVAPGQGRGRDQKDIGSGAQKRLR